MKRNRWEGTLNASSLAFLPAVWEATRLPGASFKFLFPCLWLLSAGWEGVEIGDLNKNFYVIWSVSRLTYIFSLFYEKGAHKKSDYNQNKNCHLVNCKKLKVTQSCPTLYDPMDYTVHVILQARILEWVAFPFSRRSSQSRDRTQVSHIAGRFFTNRSTREPNTRVGSLSLLQWIFPTQESKWGLLHCRWILYQLNY